MVGSKGARKLLFRMQPEDVAVSAGGRSSVVEFQPSKLAVVGSNPIARSNEGVRCET